MNYINDLCRVDSEIFHVINAEMQRQNRCIELIASENFVSTAVLAAQGSCLTNKYAEGYPFKRYYSGCHVVDQVETLAIERAKKIFNAKFVNVQPHSGSQANQAVFLALLNPGDTILGMGLSSGGHLTHGAAPNISGRWFNCVSYDVNSLTFLIDYDEIETLSMLHKPKLIIAGYSAYSRSLDFKKFRYIADKVGAYLMADISHIAGFVATGHHENPLEYVDVVTTTTHKTLRGPRGGMIMTNNQDINKKINFAIFPGLQGGPLMHIIAAKAVAFKEILTEEYNDYIRNVLDNAKILAKYLQNKGFDVITGGTDNHIVLLDLRNKNITGHDAATWLDSVGITCNKNSIPFDKKSPFITSGIRLGSAACTTKGFGKTEFIIISNMISDMLDNIDNELVKNTVYKQVNSLISRFSFY